MYDAVSHGLIPLDGSAIYLVLDAPNVQGGGYHGSYGYGNSSIVFCGTDGTIPMDCVLHEIAESAVNSAWETNVTGGEWELSVVCGDFSRKTLPDGRVIGGPVSVTIGNATFVTSQYQFDMVTQDCAVSTFRPPPPQQADATGLGPCPT